MNIGFVNLFVETSADGSVAAVFPGGLQLPDADPAAPAPGQSIRVVGPDGTIHALLFGGLDNAPPAPFLQLVAGDDFVHDPNLVLDQFANGGEISAACDTAGALIINGLQQSNFLQLSTPRKLILGTLLDFDSGAVAAGGGGSVGPFNHGLPAGVTVLTMFGVNLSIGGGENINWSVNSLSATQIGLAYREVAGIGGRSVYRGCALGLY